MTRTPRFVPVSLLAALTITALVVAGVRLAEATADEPIDRANLPKDVGTSPDANEPTSAAAEPLAGLSAQLENATVGEGDSIELDFVLLNHSEADIVLAERWNSWGAYQWSFRVVDASGAEYILRNPQMSWHRNAFTTFTIQPSKRHRTRCRLERDSWKFEDGPIAVFSEAERRVGVDDRRRGNSWTFPLSVTGTFTAPKMNRNVFGGKAGSNWAGTITTNTVQIRSAAESDVPKQLESSQERGTLRDAGTAPAAGTGTPPGDQPGADASLPLPEPEGEISTRGLTTDEEGWIRLAPLVRKDRDAKDAGWTWDGRTAEFSAGKPRAAVTFPVRITGSYELQARVTIVRAKEVTAIHLPVAGGHEVVLAMTGDRGNTESPTATISLRGLHPPAPPQGSASMTIGTEYALTCKVVRAGDKAGIEIRRDGEVLFRWTGLVSQIAEGTKTHPGTVQLETAYYTASRFTDLRFRMLAGEATPLYAERPDNTGQIAPKLPELAERVRVAPAGEVYEITTPIKRGGPALTIAVTPKEAFSNYWYDVHVTVEGLSDQHFEVRNGVPITKASIRLASLDADPYLDIMIPGGTDDQGREWYKSLIYNEEKQEYRWIGDRDDD